MKVLVTGANGMLAQAVIPALERAGHEVAPFTRAALDVTDAARVHAAVAGARPDWVCHLAAYTDVDGCETNLDHAMAVNGAGAGHAAAAARKAGAAVLAISSDYVFPGDDPRPRRESDAVGPVSAYGRSKLAGEEAVHAANPRHLIVRTAWLYGRGGKNFVDTIRERALAGTALSVVDDQHGSPTWTVDLAAALVELMEKSVTGTMHATNDGECTWYEFAREICAQAGARVDVGRRSSADLGRPAKRPAYSVLDTGLLQRTLGHGMPHWRDALARYVALPVGVTGQGR
ncbi:MAG TPA: dTDP-4-dehydrorhamnose reductase [Methylomirabilota bacterium]|nr:dTDP-4-dehydrorhamnose reductase [Methylomirabilota bacterium]